MTTLLLIRHGQSMANLGNIFAGNFNSPLSPLGKQQAHATAAYIADTYTVDAVLSSDLDRAKYTGQAVADRVGLPLVTDKRLREIDAGEWEGKTFDALTADYVDTYRVWCTDIGNAVCPGGEAVAQTQARFIGALADIAAKHDGQTVVIATHACVLRTAQCLAEGKPLSEMKNLSWVSNASVTTITVEDGVFRLVEASYDAHLGDQKSSLPANV